MTKYHDGQLEFETVKQLVGADLPDPFRYLLTSCEVFVPSEVHFIVY